MAWRVIVIGSPAQLSVRNRQLVISQEQDVSIPIEDMGALIIENLQVQMSGRLMKEMAAYNVAVFVCDEKHLPCGIYTAFQPHSRQLKVLKAQLGASLPFRKRLWKIIVERKIENQAKCLELIGSSAHYKLRVVKSKVKSGDTDNREGYAAKIYFAQLLDGGHRFDNNTFTAALNYGYAIIRGSIARSLVGYGFLPAYGIHHHNEMNRFNLADDLVEVFRPLVDLWCYSHVSVKEEFTQELRVGLAGLLQYDISVGSEICSVQRGIDVMIGSLSTAFQKGDVSLVKLPELLPLGRHWYE